MTEKFFRIALLGFLFGTQTGRGAVQWTLAEARYIYRRLIGTTVILIIIILLGWIAALSGATEVNAFLVLMLTSIVLIVGSEPTKLAIVGGAGAVLDTFRTPVQPTPGQAQPETIAEIFLTNYYNILFNIAAWGDFILVYLMVIPIKHRSISFFFVVLALVIAYKVICQAWDFPGRLAKKLIHAGLIVAITLAVFLSFPSSWYVKIFGYDVPGLLIVSSHDEVVAGSIKSENDARKKEDESFLKATDLKLKGGSRLSDEEKKRREKIIYDNSWLGKISGNFSEKPAEKKSGIKGKKESRHLALNRRERNGKIVYDTDKDGINLLPGEYHTDYPVYVFSGKDPDPMASDTKRFTLSRKTNATIVSFYPDIIVTGPQ
jgi:hypothetical protein